MKSYSEIKKQFIVRYNGFLKNIQQKIKWKKLVEYINYHLIIKEKKYSSPKVDKNILKAKLPGDKYNILKPTLLDAYILKDFSKNAFGALFLFIFIYVITQLINELPFYFRAKAVLPKTSYIIWMYILRIPYSVTLLAPPAFLFSTIFTLGNFYKNNEVVAAVGSGVYLFRLTRPIWVVGLIFSIFLVFFTEIIAVPTYDKAQDMNDTIRLTGAKRKDQFNLNITGEGRFFYSMNRYDARNSVMIEPIVIRERYNVSYVEGKKFRSYINTVIREQERSEQERLRRLKIQQQQRQNPVQPRAQTQIPPTAPAAPPTVTRNTPQNAERQQQPGQHPTVSAPRPATPVRPGQRPQMGEEVIDPIALKPIKERFELLLGQATRPSIPLYLEFRLDADKIVWNAKNKNWVVSNGILRSWDLKQGLESEKIMMVKNWVLPSRDLPYHFEMNIKQITRLTFFEGVKLIQKLKRSNKKYYNELVDLIGYHFSFQFGTFIIIFIGLTMGQFHSRKNLFVKSLLGALGLFLAYYTFFQFGASLGKQKIVNPYLAPWLGNILFFFLALLLRRRSKT